MSDIVYPVGNVSPGYCMWCGVHAGENNSTREKKWCSSKCGAAAAYWRKKNNARSPRKLIVMSVGKSWFMVRMIR